ncbi:MAG: Na(+)-translocating NADH-quinone reductase subunit A [Pseudohongiellaceae bacterium]
MIRIKRGLDLPIAGAPQQVIADEHKPRSVAVLGRDYVGMKPTMAVQVGDRVRLGQPLFSDKKNPSVIYTAPGAGVVSAINRGYQRRLHSVVIDLDEQEEALAFNSYDDFEMDSLSRATVVDDLISSGLWTALRKRPFSKVPDPESTPRALFINAMDSNPLAADPSVVLAGQESDFVLGVNLLALLPQENTWLCLGRQDPRGLAGRDYRDGVRVEQFMGPHPAGLSGTHMHFLQPAGVGSEIWTIGYQDVIAVGRLFATGRLPVTRVVSFAGPQVRQPRLLRTRLGANLDELVLGELHPHESRVLSGSVFAGYHASGDEAYLGRYHQQVSVLREGRERPLLGYLSPGANRHSVMGIYVSGFYKGKKFPLSTSTQGSERAMVPIGAYERVMPLDILPTQLLRALIVGDIEMAQNLGALELDEEDLALCSYVCPGKYEYGAILRDNLTRIEKEG